jgi:acetylornithine deacetylase
MKTIAPEAGFSYETLCEVVAFPASADDPVTRPARRRIRHSYLQSQPVHSISNSIRD